MSEFKKQQVRRKLHPRAPVFMGRRLNMTRFAQKHGLSRSYLHKILNGSMPIGRVPVEKAEIFAAAFNCTIEDLIVALRHRADVKAPLDNKV